MNIKVYTSGNPYHPSIIFLHGFPHDHLMWEEQVKELSSSFFCVTYDIKGLGRSNIDDGQYTLDFFVEELFNLIETNNIIKPTLIGLSMGGYIALRAVELDQQKFSNLILFDTRSDADGNDAKIKRINALKTINLKGLEVYCKEIIPATFSTTTKNKNPHLVNSIIERAIKFNPIGVKGCILAMMGRLDTTHFLSKINLPTLVFCGSEDQLTPPSYMKNMAEKIKNSIFIEIPETGHMSPVENSELINFKIKDFLMNQ